MQKIYIFKENGSRTCTYCTQDSNEGYMRPLAEDSQLQQTLQAPRGISPRTKPRDILQCPYALTCRGGPPFMKSLYSMREDAIASLEISDHKTKQYGPGHSCVRRTIRPLHTTLKRTPCDYQKSVLYVETRFICRHVMKPVIYPVRHTV